MKGNSETAYGMNLTHRTLWILAVIWTLVISGSLGWTLKMDQDHTLSEAKARAKVRFDNHIEYRRWNASHGGVYVPITDKSPPNPYLEHLPDRDVTTTSGERLTLVNPAYMMRQVHELQQETGKLSGHITSLKPLRPGNKADAWEAIALKAFEQGKSEFYELQKMQDGKQYFRYMQSLLVRDTCLKCHAHQGYQVGDVRGGISILVPMDTEMEESDAEMVASTFAHGFLWLLGLSTLFIGGRRQVKAEVAVRKAEATYSALYGYSRDAIMALSPLETAFLNGNPATIALFGCRDEAEFKTLSPVDLSPELQPDGQKSSEKSGQMMQIAMESGSNFFEWRHRRMDGTEFLAEVQLTRMQVGGETLLQATMRDISERKQDEERLRQRLQELERYQKATINREFRIKELRDELAQLKKEPKKEQS